MSIKTLTPLLVNTLSFGFCSSSRPIWYCRPEQPPPTTRIRRAYFSCISSGVSSRIFTAAASVIVIIFVLLCSGFLDGVTQRHATNNRGKLPIVIGTVSTNTIYVLLMYHTGWGNSNWRGKQQP